MQTCGHVENSAPNPKFIRTFHIRPRDLLSEGTYEERVARARGRVLEAIRYNRVVAEGRGLNHEIRYGSCLTELAAYLNGIDGRRAARVRSQRSKLIQLGQRLRSPQDTRRRRSALFGGADVPPDLFGRKMAQREVDRLVDIMREHLVHEALRRMYVARELQLVGNVWHIIVTVMDEHRLSIQKRSRRTRVKRDQRSFHGRPNRDRDRIEYAA